MKMKKHLTNAEIRELFSDPYSLKRGIKLWKEAEKSGEEFIKMIKEERKRMLERKI